MNNCQGFELNECAIKSGPVLNIADYKWATFDRPIVARGQVVESHGVVPCKGEGAADVAPHIPCTAHAQNCFHDSESKSNGGD